MCNDINQIMDMLDWNNSEEVQEKGRRLAAEINCLKIFMQPCDAKYNKNVWENCALILYKKNDEQLQPYLFELIEWLQDMNWPGAFKILERLKDFQKYKELAYVLDESVWIAKLTENDLWLMGMSELMEQEELIEHISKNTQMILEQYKRK